MSVLATTGCRTAAVSLGGSTTVAGPADFRTEEQPRPSTALPRAESGTAWRRTAAGSLGGSATIAGQADFRTEEQPRPSTALPRAESGTTWRRTAAGSLGGSTTVAGAGRLPHGRATSAEYGATTCRIRHRLAPYRRRQPGWLQSGPRRVKLDQSFQVTVE